MMGKCYNKIQIEAPIQKVRDTINNFHDISGAPDVVTSVIKVGDKNGDEVGAGRILNGVFHETLAELDPGNVTFSYRIDDGPGPVASDAVSDYIGTLKLTEAGSGCVIQWSSVFQSQNEEEVAGFCNSTNIALRHSLKEKMS